MGEQAITIATADGSADGFLYTPVGAGPWPGVIMFTDIMGVRPANKAMAQRLADEGFAVLQPNPFYRRGPIAACLPPGSMAERDYLGKLLVLKAELTSDLVRSDVQAYLDWLDACPEARPGKAGIIGYCMSGGFALRSAADFSDRIGAAASFHGGELATDEPDSPHLGARRIKAPLLIGHADNDALIPLPMIERLTAALDDAGVEHESEIYPAAHGWTVPGGARYDEAQAERAWARLLALFKRAL